MNPPDNLPPLPPNTRYGGLLRDYSGHVAAFIYCTEDPDGWEYSDGWIGMDYAPQDGTADWHVALPIEAVREPAKKRVPLSTRTIPPRLPQLEPTGDTLAPFLNVARGIPDNWPGECILRFDQRADGSIYLSYHGINDASHGITIDQWRKLLTPTTPDHE